MVTDLEQLARTNRLVALSFAVFQALVAVVLIFSVVHRGLGWVHDGSTQKQAGVLLLVATVIGYRRYRR